MTVNADTENGASVAPPTPVHIALPDHAVSELVTDVDFEDDRYWVPRGEDIHEWTARKGTFIFEPPGETHTLIVKAHTTDTAATAVSQNQKHMTVLFHNYGPLMHVDNNGEVCGYVDVFTRLEDCKKHYRQSGLGTDCIERLIR